MKVIIVTGSVGTGKTTVAKKLAKAVDFEYIDISKILKKHKIQVGYDQKRKSKIIDVKKLNNALIKIISERKKDIKTKGIIFDSHLSHELPKKYVDLCIVTKCDLPVLEKRLKKRKYGKNKVRENLDVEIFEICLQEAREKGHKIMIIDTTRKNRQLHLIITMMKKK